MKLILQSDDYGITRAAAHGILYGIQAGMIRNTGLFANMPWSEECVEMIKPYLHRIAFGIDLNASTGPSLLGYDKVPGLCHEDGMFYSSRENRALDETAPDHDHVDYDQVHAEFHAQVERFIELTGKVPDYIHGHAYGTKTTYNASLAIAREYHRPFTRNVVQRENVGRTMGWYLYGAGPEEQLKEDPLTFITEDRDHLLEKEYGYIVTHCGYVDAELFKLSSFNTCRAKDLEAVCDPRFKEWIEKNNIEMIDFRELMDWAE